jgi:energy-coupling factor transporter ATP-binding protein EcfA2
VRRQVAQRGVLLGTDMHERVPVHHEMFGADGRENANAVVVGTTGSGKTTFLLALALRLALQGYKIFFLDPTVMCRKLLELIGDRAAVAYHEVNERMAINILDRQSDRLIDQRDAVVRRLQTALGKPRQLDGRTTVTPYELTDREIGALDAALQDERIYGVDGHRLAAMTPDTAPLLQALATVLQDLSSERPDAGRLARRITDRLLGSASAIYNQPTELRFDPTIQVNLFSLRGVKKERLPLIYSWLFDNIRDYVWSPERDTPNTPVISILDEYFVLKSVPLLEEAVITDTKTGRGRQFGVITADQQAKTYYDDAHGSAGAFITGNARQKFFFYTDEEADLLASVYQNKLTPAHIMQLRTLKRGECLAMLDQDVRALQVELTPLEKRVLLA